MNEINLTGNGIYRNSGTSELIEKAKSTGTDVLLKADKTDSYKSGTEEFLAGYENLSVYQSSASNLSGILNSDTAVSYLNFAISALQTKLASAEIGRAHV